jgi:hypothetical protein
VTGVESNIMAPSITFKRQMITTRMANMNMRFLGGRPLAADVFIKIPKLKAHKKCELTVNLKSLVGFNANKNWLPHYIVGSSETGGDQFDKQQVRGRLENSIVVRAKERLLYGSTAFQYIARNTKRAAYQIFGTNDEVVRSGNWHGGDIVWRMSVDLNRILLYANPDGPMRNASEPKGYFSFVDGIYAMEGNGPVGGMLKKQGSLLVGLIPSRWMRCVPD